MWMGSGCHVSGGPSNNLLQSPVLTSQIVMFAFFLLDGCSISTLSCALTDTTDPTVPKMKELIKFAGVERTINIPEEIGTKYSHFGIFLLEDGFGATIHNIEWQYRYNSEAINIEILRRWLEGKGRKPVEWNTLIEVLKEISKHTLAKDIENGLKKLFQDI